MKQREAELIISVILIATLIAGFFPYSNSNTPTGYAVLDQACQPYSQKCGLDNIKYECNSQGDWYRSDCPATDFCTEISQVTVECNERT